jgi:hypothetical protein
MKFLGSLILAMVLSVSALAQYPTSPNTGKATTPYTTGVFSATFNGPVTAKDSGRNTANTSSDVTYVSSTDLIAQAVVVRTIDHAIAVDFTSSDFYVSDLQGCDTKDNISKGYWDNHPLTYVFCTYTTGGQTYTLRVRFIIVNSTTVLMVKQLALEANNDRDQWLDFEYSLRIR